MKGLIRLRADAGEAAGEEESGSGESDVEEHRLNKLDMALQI